MCIKKQTLIVCYSLKSRLCRWGNKDWSLMPYTSKKLLLNFDTIILLTCRCCIDELEALKVELFSWNLSRMGVVRSEKASCAIFCEYKCEHSARMIINVS